MKPILKTLFPYSIFIFVLSSSTFPLLFVQGASPQCIEGSGASQELVLLRGEHVLVLNASEDVNMFSVKYVFPPEYSSQVPILFEWVNDTTAHIIHYTIDNDTLSPNKVMNFTLAPMLKNESVTLHFNYWVLVKNNNYSDLPNDASIPTVNELPAEVKPWLISTEVVEAHNILIRFRAQQLQGADDNLRDLAFKIAKFTRNHHYLFFLIQLKLGTFWVQDAITTLLINGECPGRSHLGCALFRANNVPARVILVNANYSFWYQMHFMTEYYFPGYGWIPTETHKGITPYEPKHQIILRICSLEDENDTHTDYIFPKMTGVEHWIWINNTHIYPYYGTATLEKGCRTNMFPEQNLTVDNQTADTAFTLTTNIFYLYQHTIGLNLNSENLSHFHNATQYQKDAIDILHETGNITGYILQMDNAYAEYQEITS